MATYWPNDIGNTGDTIPVLPAEACTEVGHEDDFDPARGVINAIILTVVCALVAIALAAWWAA